MPMYKQHDKEYLYEASKQYRDIVFSHQSAMTGEELHSKIDIAHELAYRDLLIVRMSDFVSGEYQASDEFIKEVAEFISHLDN